MTVVPRAKSVGRDPLASAETANRWITDGALWTVAESVGVLICCWCIDDSQGCGPASCAMTVNGAGKAETKIPMMARAIAPVVVTVNRRLFIVQLSPRSDFGPHGHTTTVTVRGRQTRGAELFIARPLGKGRSLKITVTKGYKGLRHEGRSDDS